MRNLEFQAIPGKQDDAHGCASVAGGMDDLSVSEVMLNEPEGFYSAPGATVRDYAAQQGVQVEVALAEGMKKKAEEFREQGAEIYKEA